MQRRCSCGRAGVAGRGPELWRVPAIGRALHNQASKRCQNRLNNSSSYTSTSGRHGRRALTVQVSNALFEPPAFQPSKLSVEFLPGADAQGPAPPCARRYTLTHNDITGALQLSIGAKFNARQVRNLYTRVLRDEVVAEWRFGGGTAEQQPQQQQQQQQEVPIGLNGGTGSGKARRRRDSGSGVSSSGRGGAADHRPSLHVFCHVSGEERWLAPPQLRNFIFRREMTLVLDTLLFADQELLRGHPWLRSADVLVHFQSAQPDLDAVEHWGTLGDRTSWQRLPKGVAARLQLLLGGFPDGRRLQRQPCGGLLLDEGGGRTRLWGAEQAAALGKGGAARNRGCGFVGAAGGGANSGGSGESGGLGAVSAPATISSLGSTTSSSGSSNGVRAVSNGVKGTSSSARRDLAQEGAAAPNLMLPGLVVVAEADGSTCSSVTPLDSNGSSSGHSNGSGGTGSTPPAEGASSPGAASVPLPAVSSRAGAGAPVATVAYDRGPAAGCSGGSSSATTLQPQPSAVRQAGRVPAVVAAAATSGLRRQ